MTDPAQYYQQYYQYYYQWAQQQNPQYNHGSQVPQNYPYTPSQQQFYTGVYPTEANNSFNAVQTDYPSQVADDSSHVSQPAPRKKLASDIRKEQNKLPFKGNPKTMNIDNFLLRSLQMSDYFKSLYDYKTYHEVLQEIKDSVDTLETRTSNGVSPAFCLLYKLHTLKITKKQLNGMLNSKNHPFVKSIGLMFMRYTFPAEKLWDAFEPYLKDQENFTPIKGRNEIAIGYFSKMLLQDPKYLNTLMPRINPKIQKKIDENISQLEKEYSHLCNSKRDRSHSPKNGRRSRHIRRGSPNEPHRRRKRCDSIERSARKRRRSSSYDFDRYRDDRKREDRHRYREERHKRENHKSRYDDRDRYHKSKDSTVDRSKKRSSDLSLKDLEPSQKKQKSQVSTTLDKLRDIM
eukprot:gb/GECH01004338.1/.p1 GENE.gb/GECH01004338.1/~~gb/GECH01004338.1/.p1  ORF type:complete len:403 (+),score=72.68 gb/GECH01004338.1/:1-1209(+)